MELQCVKILHRVGAQPPLRKGVNINISPSGNVLKVNESVVNALLVCSKVRLRGGG